MRRAITAMAHRWAELLVAERRRARLRGDLGADVGAEGVRGVELGAVCDARDTGGGCADCEAWVLGEAKGGVPRWLSLSLWSDWEGVVPRAARAPGWAARWRHRAYRMRRRHSRAVAEGVLGRLLSPRIATLPIEERPRRLLPRVAAGLFWAGWQGGGSAGAFARSNCVTGTGYLGMWLGISTPPARSLQDFHVPFSFRRATASSKSFARSLLDSEGRAFGRGGRLGLYQGMDKTPPGLQESEQTQCHEHGHRAAGSRTLVDAFGAGGQLRHGEEEQAVTLLLGHFFPQRTDEIETALTNKGGGVRVQLLDARSLPTTEIFRGNVFQQLRSRNGREHAPRLLMRTCSFSLRSGSFLPPGFFPLLLAIGFPDKTGALVALGDCNPHVGALPLSANDDPVCLGGPAARRRADARGCLL